MIERTFDAVAVNVILNAEGVREGLATPDIEALDCAAILSDPRNVGFICEGGAVIFAQIDPGIYEVHVAFLPGWRGAYALAAARAAVMAMFMKTDAMTLLFRVPDDNPAARRFFAMLGAGKEFHREYAWPGADGLIGMSFMALRYEQWVLRQHELIIAGRGFYSQMEFELQRIGSAAVRLPQDSCAYLYAGAFARMSYAGQLDKAVILYNRFARFAFLPTITLISRSPAVVDFARALIQVKDGSFKAILAR